MPRSKRTQTATRSKQIKTPDSATTSSSASNAIATPALANRTLRMSYRIARGEQGVLTFEPYKSALLPLWRFRDPAIARKSADDLTDAFKKYEAVGDFVGMDMARKFIQMGMTRSMRYARHKGGRKYARDDKGERGKELEVTEHEGKDEKLEASAIFKERWRMVKERDGYTKAKGEFLAEQKEWDKMVKKGEVDPKDGIEEGEGMMP